MSHVPPDVGEARYQLAGVGAAWSRRGALLLGRLLARFVPQPSYRSSAVTVKVRRVADLNLLRRVAIRAWMAWVFAWRTRWADFDWYVSAHTNDRLVSIAGVVDRAGAVGGVPTHLGLLGAVFTVPEARGRGFASDVIRSATRLMTDELGCQFGVLICVDGLVPFYERLGWKRVSNAMRFERFGRTGYAQGNVMVYECAGQPLPGGTIDLLGLPA